MVLRELALFAGAGGGILGSRILGFDTVCAVENNDYCRRVLLQRQIDGCLDPFPIWDDIRTFDGRPWRGYVDIVTGGFPCQDISSAGTRKGLAGSRSGLWFEMSRIVGEVRPTFVLAENSPHLRTNGLGTVVSELASLGYDSRWGVLGARHVGANHRRDRMWIIASDADGQTVRQQSGRGLGSTREEETVLRVTDWWDSPRFAGVDDGSANGMERVSATGNMQVPGVVALAWEMLTGS